MFSNNKTSVLAFHNLNAIRKPGNNKKKKKTGNKCPQRMGLHTVKCETQFYSCHILK